MSQQTKEFGLNDFRLTDNGFSIMLPVSIYGDGDIQVYTVKEGEEEKILIHPIITQSGGDTIISVIEKIPLYIEY